MKNIYYWFLCSYDNAGGGRTLEEHLTENVHPFEEMKELKEGAPFSARYRLENWKEVTKSEYNLGMKYFKSEAKG